MRRVNVTPASTDRCTSLLIRERRDSRHEDLCATVGAAASTPRLRPSPPPLPSPAPSLAPPRCAARKRKFLIALRRAGVPSGGGDVDRFAGAREDDTTTPRAPRGGHHRRRGWPSSRERTSAPPRPTPGPPAPAHVLAERPWCSQSVQVWGFSGSPRNRPHALGITRQRARQRVPFPEFDPLAGGGRRRSHFPRDFAAERRKTHV